MSTDTKPWVSLVFNKYTISWLKYFRLNWYCSLPFWMSDVCEAVRSLFFVACIIGSQAQIRKVMTKQACKPSNIFDWLVFWQNYPEMSFLNTAFHWFWFELLSIDWFSSGAVAFSIVFLVLPSAVQPRDSRIAALSPETSAFSQQIFNGKAFSQQNFDRKEAGLFKRVKSARWKVFWPFFLPQCSAE